MGEFKAVVGSHLTDDQAQKYGVRIKVLEEKNGGVTPEIVLDDARKKTSPLHDYFEWNDHKAADLYRIDQSRYLIRSINVVIIRDGQEEMTRAFHPVIVREEKQDKGKKYLSAQVVFSDTDYRRQTIEDALKELGGWRKRYQQYSELSSIFQSIDAVKAQLGQSVTA